jgi:Ni,Fe-hydrogenase I cytochrome b subunit
MNFWMFENIQLLIFKVVDRLTVCGLFKMNFWACKFIHKHKSQLTQISTKQKIQKNTKLIKWTLQLLKHPSNLSHMRPKTQLIATASYFLVSFFFHCNIRLSKKENYETLTYVIMSISSVTFSNDSNEKKNNLFAQKKM